MDNFRLTCVRCGSNIVSVYIEKTSLSYLYPDDKTLRIGIGILIKCEKCGARERLEGAFVDGMGPSCLLDGFVKYDE